MFFRRFFRFGLIVILLLGMFGIVRSAAYRSGWSEGYVSGQTADGVPAESSPDAPFNSAPRRGPGFGGIFSLFWWSVAAFFKFWFFLFFIGLIFKLLFWGRRGRHGGPWKGHWKGGHWGWHGHHKGHAQKGDEYKGQRPPWFDDSDGEPVMKA